MDTKAGNERTTDNVALVVRMAMMAWQSQNTRVSKLLEELGDKLLEDIAPGKNSGVYLLGHLVAVNDNLLPLFGFGEKLYPQLDELFLKNPDKSGREYPSATELKKYWKAVNEKLTGYFESMSPEEWLTRHNAVSQEDFAKEPHRNKLNVLLNRTTHQGYHLGQLVLLR